MTPDKWQQVKALFESALEREPGERAAFLDRECAGDEALRKEVETLLASHDDSASFMESPAVEDAAADLLADEQKLQAGQRIGRYEIVALIGEGGMGEVYLAHDTRLGRKVALKLLPTYLSKDKDRLRRFAQEARAASALSHPNVCMIYEVGETEEGRPFIAMEYVDAVTLRQYMERTGRKLSEVLEVAAQIASALTAAHEAGITHRDIKPENIMLRRDGYVKVLDFGLAKLAERQPSRFFTKPRTKTGVKTEPGVVLGTAQYMSPEQARGLPVDARTDIWSLGVVLYEMASGRAPFEGSTTSDVIAAVLERESPPLARYAREIPEALEWIVAKALRKDREERYQTAKELLTDLRGLKQRLEFEAELERSAPPNEMSGALAVRSSGQAASAAPKPAARTAEVGKAHPTSSAEYIVGEIKRHRRGAVLALATLIVAVAGIIYFYYSGHNDKAAINSIAVLPFTNVGGDADAEYLSDGITESTINSLSRLSNLKVIARSSVFQYKGKETDPQVVARELGVRAVLIGRIMQRGGNLKVSAELVDSLDKSRLWGEEYNRNAADILEVQEEIAKDIAESLRLKLSGEEQKQLTKHYTENTEAYLLYSKGRYHYFKESEDGLTKAVESFNQAIARDPNYALAYAGLADAYSVLGDYYYLEQKEAFPKAKAAAQKALEIDNTLAEAHASMAKVKELDWDWSGAEREYKRAIELNANYAAARLYYTAFLSKMLRHDEAMVEIKRAQELDPLSLSIKAQIAGVFYFARQYDQAIEQCKTILEMDSNFTTAQYNLGYAYLAKGMYEEAITAYQKSIQLEGSLPVILLALAEVYAASGKKDEAQKILDQMNSTKEYVPPIGMIDAYARLGNREQAFKWLQKAYEDRDGQLGYLKVNPGVDSLRSDPRFQEMLRRVGLTP